ncbi:MAG: Uma2 family endonuclease [Nonomuraea sp.]|nr:Uma2 family endonuclease [Nonomuraea sp.]
MVATMVEDHHKLEQADDEQVLRGIRESLDALPQLPGYRAEIINGGLIVTPAGTPEHGLRASRLYRALIPVMDKRSWDAWTGTVDVCVEGPRDQLEPDFVLAPLGCPRWGPREFLSSGLIMVAEVVSPSSVRQDREDKPDLYATGLVPIYLLIDPLAAPPSVTVFSGIEGGAYRTVSTVPMGKPLHLPDPVDFELDTSIFKV